MKICVVSPLNYPHSQAFTDLARCLSAAFADLGMDVPVANKIEKGAIILGANLLDGDYKDLIIYNLEQITPESPWVQSRYIDILKKNEVWDYSEINIAELKKMGIEAKLVPIGYHECLKIEKKDPVYDVLFYGSVNDRRAKILNELSSKCKSFSVFGVYGHERDKLIAQSKIVLNLHYYDSKVFEIVRASPILASGINLISEIGSGSEPFHSTDGFVPYDGLVDKCIESLDDDSIGRRGFDIFSKMKQSDYLLGVL